MEEHRNRLRAKHPENPFGYWEIRGEDPNCDLGGYHYQPLLTRVEGNYFDAVELALSLDGFFSWGGGGSITKLEFNKLEPGSAARIAALKERRSKAVRELSEIETELRKYGEKL